MATIGKPINVDYALIYKDEVDPHVLLHMVDIHSSKSFLYAGSTDLAEVPNDVIKYYTKCTDELTIRAFIRFHQKILLHKMNYRTMANKEDDKYAEMYDVKYCRR